MPYRIRSFVIVLALGAAAAAQAQQPSFGTLVAIGDSLAAGTVSSSLLETHQRHSVPALIARQAGVTDFQQPLVGEPGIPPELVLTSLVPAPLIARKSNTLGSPLNLGLSRSYNNLAVPGANLGNALNLVTDAGGLHDVILRGRGSQVQQAVALRPSAILVWIGNNDVLGAATSGRALEGVTLTPAAVFRTRYEQLITTLKATGAFIVAANLPDVTTIPFVTTIQPVVTSPTTGQPVIVGGQPVPLIGPNGPLPSGSRVTLGAGADLAQGIGIPTALGGRGTPLRDEVVLDPTELGLIQDRVAQDNQAIREICQAAGVPVLDIHGILTRFAAEGQVVGGIRFSSAFLTGGIFSYDGVHPSELGYAIVANEWIKAINAAGGQLPPIDLLPFTGAKSAGGAASTASVVGERPPTPPFEFSTEAWESLRALFPPVDR
jgi:lysophospholipase L1-like esterase